MNHVGLGREFRMRPVTDELRHREAAIGDVAIERAIGEGTLGRHEVHLRLLLEPLAEVPELRNLRGADAERVLRFQIN